MYVLYVSAMHQEALLKMDLQTRAVGNRERKKKDGGACGPGKGEVHNSQAGLKFSLAIQMLSFTFVDLVLLRSDITKFGTKIGFMGNGCAATARWHAGCVYLCIQCGVGMCT